MASVPKSPYSAALQAAYPATAALEAAGLDVNGFLAEFSLSEADFGDPDRRIDQAVLAALWDRAAIVTGDEQLGLHAVRYRKPRLVVDYLLLHSATLGEMLQRGIDFEAVWQQGRRGRLERGDARALVEWRLDEPIPWSRSMSDYVLASFVLLSRRLTGNPLPIESVSFPVGPPERLDEHRALFGSTLHFHAGIESVHFAGEALDWPILRSDPDLLSVLERHARDVAARLPAPRTVAGDVRRCIAEGLLGQAPHIDSVARSLGTSTRTLRRRLDEEGTSYKELLDTVRRELASEYLSQREVAIGEIALLLGYADPAAFGKAFRRWTGISPSEFRGQARPLEKP